MSLPVPDSDPQHTGDAVVRLAERPPLLTAAAALTGLQGLVLAGYAALELLHLTGGRVTMGVTTAGFFLLYGVALLVCAAGLLRVATWARSPVVLTQLIQLGLAWSFRGGETTVVALVLAGVAVVVLFCVFHPLSTAALVDDPTADTRTD